MKKIAKSRRPEAERAAEWAAVEVFGCTMTRRALRTKFAKVDFFGCDIIGIRANGTKVWVQVTAGQMRAVQVRRNKLEMVPWDESDSVYVLQLVERQDVANPRRKLWFFRMWAFRFGAWLQKVPIDIKPEWFKAMKEA